MSTVNRWAATLLGLTLVSAHAAPLRPPSAHTGAEGFDATSKPHAGSVTDLGSIPSASTHPIRSQPPRDGLRVSRAHRTPQQARALAISMARSINTSETDVRCLVKLWTRESNFRPQALNRSSGAGGIPQILGLDPATPTHRQIERGLAYIAKRYKTPCAAWSHHQRKGWY